jgi:exopolysaccharide biosynthesis protein
MRSLLIAPVVCAFLLLTHVADAAELRDVALTEKTAYFEIALKFDSTPSFSETRRYSPDRYVLTFAKTKPVVPKPALEKLSALSSKFLSRISIAASGEDTAVGFYLNIGTLPLVRKAESGYTVRIYKQAQQRTELTLGPGVTLVQREVAGNPNVCPGGNLALYLVRVMPDAKASIYSVAADRYDHKTRSRTPSSFARKESADVVINGGFFGGKGQHLSTLVEDGVMRATGVYPTRPMLVITEEGEVLLGRYNVETSLLFGGKRLTISAKNYPFESGKTIVYDSTYPLDTLPQTGMFYYTLTGGKLKFYAADTKGLTLASGQLLLATDIMPEANPLKQIPDGSEVRVETRITDSAGNKLLAQSAIGGAPMLVEAGKVALSNEDDKVKDDIAKSVRSRTAVGLARDGSLLLAVVREDEDCGFGGLTLDALARLLISEGAVTAMNLDGGGSSAMVVAGLVLNEPVSEERGVSNALVLKLQ